jgi:hypothetical protein
MFGFRYKTANILDAKKILDGDLILEIRLSGLLLFE